MTRPVLLACLLSRSRNRHAAPTRRLRGHFLPTLRHALLGWVFILAGLVGIGRAEEVFFDFSSGPQGWEPGFADYPVGAELDYQLDAMHTTLPGELGNLGAWFIAGSNQSDDLFMYFKRQIDGLKPSTTYDIHFEISLASKAPAGSVGIGGSPAHSVYMKAGASTLEPMAVADQDGNYRMNWDKGEQAGGGRDAVVLGDIAKPDDGSEEFVIIQRTSQEALRATTDSEGRLWLLFGTDSGFEGRTSLYYTSFAAQLVEVPEPGSAGLLVALAAAVSWARRRRGARS